MSLVRAPGGEVSSEQLGWGPGRPWEGQRLPPFSGRQVKWKWNGFHIQWPGPHMGWHRVVGPESLGAERTPAEGGDGWWGAVRVWG